MRCLCLIVHNQIINYLSTCVNYLSCKAYALFRHNHNNDNNHCFLLNACTQHKTPSHARLGIFEQVTNCTLCSTVGLSGLSFQHDYPQTFSPI